MTAPSVAVVDLGRPGALGATRRVESWSRIFSAAGACVEVIPLLQGCRTPARRALPEIVQACVHPARVPESALWCPSRLRTVLASIEPDVVVLTTARTVAPGTVPLQARVVLDYVDHLSANYAQRARLARDPVRTVGFRLLARQMRRFEQVPWPTARQVAAGAADAAALGVEWVPNALPPARPAEARPTHDLLFVGTLDYVPNVEALHRIAHLWPAVQRVRPKTSLLVAGTRPTRAVRALVATNRWTLWEDFPSLDDVCARVRVAVAPQRHGTGIQNKLLEAAARGLPQVVSPGVMGGVGVGFPAVVADDDCALITETVALLDDVDRRARLGASASRFVQERFGVQRWAGWARDLLAEPVALGPCAVERIT